MSTEKITIQKQDPTSSSAHLFLPDKNLQISTSILKYLLFSVKYIFIKANIIPEIIYDPDQIPPDIEISFSHGVINR